MVQCSDLSAANPTWNLRSFAAEDITIKPGNEESVRFKADGKVGIGTDNPQANLHIFEGTGSTRAPAASGNNLVIDSNSEVGMSLLFGTDANTAYGNIYWGNSTDGSSDGRITYFGSTYATAADRQAMVFRTANTERLRISSNGKLTSTRTSTTAYNSAATTNDSGFLLLNHGAAGHATLQFQSLSSGTAQTGQATISSFNETAGSKNTALTFGTRQNSDATIRERLRITSDGTVGINNASPSSTYKLDVLVLDNLSPILILNQMILIQVN